jgi:hypothetical protein
MLPSMLVPSRWLAATPCLAPAALCVLRREALCVVQAVTSQLARAAQAKLLLAGPCPLLPVLHNAVQAVQSLCLAATATAATVVSSV